MSRQVTAETQAAVDDERSPASASRPVLLIPAYEPPRSLSALVAELLASGAFGAAVVVDDGSADQRRGVFAAIDRVDQADVLRHAVNLGKGAALKTGMNFAACRYPGSVGIVTADADGQHAVSDIVATAESLQSQPRSLILGARSFGADVPLRSRFGNLLTRGVMRVATGAKISDTQTGLRGVPMDFVPELLKLKPTGYDFELDMLLSFRASGGRLREIPIETIYIDGNRDSHFDPLLDSMRIYFVFVRFGGVSLATAVIDNVLFALSIVASGNVLLSQVIARLFAGFFNYFANKVAVFCSAERDRVALPKYWLAVAASGTLSYVLIRTVVEHLPIAVIPAKLAVESFLFFVNFLIQRHFVFAERRAEAENSR